MSRPLRPPIRRCVDLFHHRWSLPIVALLYAGRGEKFVTLVNRLGISRDSATSTLAHLIDRGIVQRNAGYGHPMRPEYILTPSAARLGEAAHALARIIAERELSEVAGKKWALPAVLAIHRGASRFADIAQLLESVTPRSLSAALKSAEDASLVTRTVLAGYPPSVVYGLTELGQDLAPALERLAVEAEAMPRLPER